MFVLVNSSCWQHYPIPSAISWSSHLVRLGGVEAPGGPCQSRWPRHGPGTRTRDFRSRSRAVTPLPGPKIESIVMIYMIKELPHDAHCFIFYSLFFFIYIPSSLRKEYLCCFVGLIIFLFFNWGYIMKLMFTKHVHEISELCVAIFCELL